MHLLRAVNVVAFKDAQPFRRSVFDYLSGHKRPVRAARAVHRWLGDSPLSTALCAVYGARAFLALDLPPGEVLAVGRYANEARQFDYVERCLGRPVARADTRTTAALRPAAWLAALRLLGCPESLRFAWRVLDRHNRRGGDFLVACRVAATLGYGLRMRPALKKIAPRAVLVSSDSNPYAMAAAASARALGIKTIYVTHGHIPDGPPFLDFDLSIVDGPAVLAVYDDSLGRRGQVVFKGAEGRYRPLQLAALEARAPTLTVGLFASLIVDWGRFGALLGRIRAHLKPAKIILRLHPNETIRDPAALDRLDLTGVEVSLGEAVLTDDAAQCDLVIAGESSCHLTLLKFGVPTVYVPGLDLCPPDFYRFLRLGVVFDARTPEEIELSNVARFYADPAWAGRFRAFDASYGAEPLDASVGEALAALLGDG